MASADHSVDRPEPLAGAKFDLASAQQALQEHGVAVIPGVIPAHQCDRHVASLHQWLTRFGDSFPKNIGSVIHTYNIGHCEVAWQTRLASKPVFAALWGTDKLLTSTDGVSISRPPELGATDFAVEGKHSLHHDQGIRKLGLHAYQGAVYLEEADDDDWCMEMLYGSHNVHTEFFQDVVGKAEVSEFRLLNGGELEWFLDKGCVRKRVGCPKGGIVLWDSRTVHAGAHPLVGRKHPQRWRHVVFVSMEPAVWATEKDYHAKKEAYDKLKTGPHWAGQGASSFCYSKSQHDTQEQPECAKSEEVRLMAGDIRYDFEDGKSNGPSWKPMFQE